MIFRPHDYQSRAIQKIINQPKVGLFLDMGLGKTVITMTAVSELIYERFEIRRALVIAPKRVAEDTWTREAAKWDHLRSLVISPVLGTAKERTAALETEADIYVIGRDNVAWLVELLQKRKKGWPFDMIIIDELSSFKNPQAKRFRAIRKALPCTQRVVGLTGTPSPNGLMDLWAELYLLDQGERLGRTLGRYRDEFFRPGMRNGYVVYKWELRKGAQEEIKNRIADICVSMSAQDYMQLPARIDRQICIKLDPKEKALYETMEQAQILQLSEDKTVVALNAAAVMSKLLQMANGSVYTDSHEVIRIHEKKAEALAEIVDTTSEPALVFYSFRHDIGTIRRWLPEAKELKTTEDIAAWNRGEIKVLLAHPASVGFGLNLQEGGHIIVWYGLTWSLELYQQANARLHRQGQARPVIIHHLIAEGTVDEQVIKALERKDTSQAALMAALKERSLYENQYNR